MLRNDGNSKASKQCKEMKCEKEEEEGVINVEKTKQKISVPKPASQQVYLALI